MRGKMTIAVLCAASAAAALTVSPSRADSIPPLSVWPCLGLSGAAYVACVQQQVRHPTVAFGSPFGNPGPLLPGYVPYHPGCECEITPECEHSGWARQ